MAWKIVAANGNVLCITITKCAAELILRAYKRRRRAVALVKVSK